MPARSLAVATDAAAAAAANAADLRDFLRQLRAEGKSPATIRTYANSLARLAEAFPGRTLVSLAKPDIQDWLIRMGRDRAPGSVGTYYRGAGRFYRWAAEEGLVEASPMATTHPPRVPVLPLPIPPRADIAAILAVVDRARDFEGTRDAAIIRTWCEAGSPRRAEMAAMTLADVDLDAEVIRITHGKGGKFRVFPLSAPTTRAWARYLRLRARSPYAASDRAVLGLAGPMTGSGLYKMLARRCSQAGVTPIHPHQFRHFATDAYLSAGGQERDMMRLNGWADPAMLSRYGAANADRRATAAARQLAIGAAL